jgi:hypothetical protein
MKIQCRKEVHNMPFLIISGKVLVTLALKSAAIGFGVKAGTEAFDRLKEKFKK